MVDGLRERDFISNTFGRYVDKEIARKLMSRPETAELGGVRREVAILMSDLRGFTALCETMSPEAIIGIVNRYFSHMIEIIHQHQGIIVDFFGDAILVFFDPLNGPIKSSVRDAVRCALDMQAEMNVFNKEEKENGLPKLHMGIGINADDVIVGNIGSESRSKYGVVGAPVNLTARIQSVAKKGEVLVSEHIYNHIKSNLQIIRQFRSNLKGVHGAVNLFVVGGLE